MTSSERARPSDDDPLGVPPAVTDVAPGSEESAGRAQGSSFWASAFWGVGAAFFVLLAVRSSSVWASVFWVVMALNMASGVAPLRRAVVSHWRK